MTENIGLYGLAFLFGTIKFLFSATILNTTSLEALEIAIFTGLGAIFSFNVFYWTADYFIERAKKKKIKAMLNGTYKHKPVFTKMNKIMVRAKTSKSGFWLICLFAPLFLSIPVGAIIIARFYHHNKLAYPIAVASLCILAFVLSYTNDAIFDFFGK